jgi:3-methylcrotonyl-CoA carboxylase alpha subunit
MDEATRAELCAAAVRAAQAVDYVGAGTIEFIADGSEGLRADRIWFMEMNTRLQVEHPVTEEITGVDLVEWQLRVASGEPLPKRQDELAIDGWAMEARLYAEDPAKGFLPSTGGLDHLVTPGDRIETGVYEGAEVSPFYDPMIAKLVVHAADRKAAIAALANDCGGVEVWPVRTNAAFLRRALLHPAFESGEVTTNFIAANEAALVESPVLHASLTSDAAVALVAREIDPIGSTYGTPSEELRFKREGQVWRQAIGFRLNAPDRLSVAFAVDGGMEVVNLPNDWRDRFTSSETTSAGIVVFDEGEALAVRTRVEGSHGGHGGDGAILAPMPGKVIAVEVAAGQTVTKGQKLLTLEAMKMEHTLTAPFDGTVAELNAVAGAQVQVEALLAKIEAAAE